MKPDASKTVRRLPSQKRAEETRNKIIEAALAVLATDGLEAFTTRKLAKTAGLSIGSIYVYFPTKESVLFHIYKDRLDERLSRFDRIFSDDNLQRSGKELFEMYVQDMQAARMWSSIDLELRNSVERDTRMQDYTHQYEHELTSRYVRLWKHYGSRWPDEKLEQLATYAHGIDHLNMKLIANGDKAAATTFSEITMEVFHTLSRMTGARYDEDQAA